MDASRRMLLKAVGFAPALVEANRELIARFEQKLQAKLAEIWGKEGV